MGWNNWIYLGVGLGLGVSFSWLLGRWGKRADSSAATHEAKTEATPDLPTVVEKLKASQLAYQLAQEMSQFKAGFLARTSHELRSPLNSLIGFHQLILSELCDNPDEEREFVAHAHKAALKLLKLLDEILDVARIEHATNQLEIQPLQLARVLEEVYQLTYLLAANRNFRFQVSPPDAEIYVLADPRSLRQVLVSLIEISIAQMEEGNICVSAKTSPADGVVHIWLDVPLNASAWSQEAVDLLQSEHTPTSEPLNKNAAPSLGLTLMLNQTLLELIKGRLEVLPLPATTDESPLTRIQLALPIVIPETAFFG
jgi:signal transduction histidine kinase